MALGHPRSGTLVPPARRNDPEPPGSTFLTVERKSPDNDPDIQNRARYVFGIVCGGAHLRAAPRCERSRCQGTGRVPTDGAGADQSPAGLKEPGRVGEKRSALQEAGSAQGGIEKA